MQLDIPWWGKIIVKLILSRVPFGYSTWRYLGLFRQGQMDQPAYAIEVFKSHCKYYHLNGELSGRVILELGPGDSVATAIIAASYGATAVLVDTGAYASSDLSFYKSLADRLRLMGLSPPEISGVEDLDSVLKICRATYLTGGLASLKAIASDSIDFIFSQAVLEHVKENEFLETMIECRRILNKTGMASHRVDLKDHLTGGLNNLRFQRRLWESSIFFRSGFYTNRIRFSRIIALMRQAGFSIDTCISQRWDVIPIPRRKLAAEFAYQSDEDLMVKEFHVVLR
jgi:hypothetical protein